MLLRWQDAVGSVGVYVVKNGSRLKEGKYTPDKNPNVCPTKAACIIAAVSVGPDKSVFSHCEVWSAIWPALCCLEMTYRR